MNRLTIHAWPATLIAVGALATLSVTAPYAGAVTPTPHPGLAAAPTCGSKPVTIEGTAGADTIEGTAGDDVIAARAGNDVVRSRGGNDTICLGLGRDIVKAGTGNDTVVAESTLDGRDDVVGNAGQDRMDYFSRTAGVDVSLDSVGDDGAPGELDNIRLSVENVGGSLFDDRLVGSDAANVLDGQQGDDDMRGDVGDDLLRGGGDDDLLIGNAGDDFLLGNDGDDIALAACCLDGADFYEGGTGRDLASYTSRVANVQLSIDNVANDGEFGEGDNIRSDVEDLIGGNGNDRLSALLGFSPNRLFGGPGLDIVDTRDPFIVDDVADGGTSNDLCLTDDLDLRISCEF